MPERKNSFRRIKILQSLAEILEQNPGARITTARIAQQVGVTEAALYRHFPSKAKMFEGLIEFIETTIFSRITIILKEEKSAASRCQKIIYLLITFAELNPGITRILTGDPLTGESERLRGRVVQFFDRFETQLKQVLRESALSEDDQPRLDVQITANLMLSVAEGRISQYVRSDFTRLPTTQWNEQWNILQQTLFQKHGSD
ncbi:MAG: nucleoid occlusion factor SlmA [Gammaproteobacteria bacterium]|nr:nucleoid occlusion factor SlmA [Gammaproteobacteria bacterium]